MKDLKVLLGLGLVACGGPPVVAEDTHCEPSSGTICTVVGTGIAGLADEDVPAVDADL